MGSSDSNIIAYMDKATGGEVIFDGIDLSDVDADKLTEIRREKNGLVFQQFHLVPYLMSEEGLSVALSLNTGGLSHEKFFSADMRGDFYDGLQFR